MLKIWFTSWAIETCHYVLDITPVFLGEFLHFLYQWKEKSTLYTTLLTA